METLYDVLGAHPDDDAESLKNAYRKAAKANHPDRHACDPEAVVRFTQIVTAYDTLRDPVRRAGYDRLLEYQRGPPRSKARNSDVPKIAVRGGSTDNPPTGRRTTYYSAHQFAFNAIIGAVVGMLVGGGLLFVRIHGITGDELGGRTAGQPPSMAAVEPAKRADTAKREVPSHGTAREPRISATQGAIASAVEGKGASEMAQGPSAPDAAGQTTGRSAHSIDTGPKADADGPGRDHGAERLEQPQSTEPKTIAMSQDEICKRDAAQLARLRISQERDEVIRFQRELDCEELRPQVNRLRESVDPPIDPTGPKADAGGPGRDHGAERPEQPEQPQSTEPPRSAEPQTTAMPEDEICKRDAAQLAHLRISQEPDEVIRFERELGCEKLRPQVIRLRESVDPK